MANVAVKDTGASKKKKQQNTSIFPSYGEALQIKRTQTTPQYKVDQWEADARKSARQDLYDQQQMYEDRLKALGLFGGDKSERKELRGQIKDAKKQIKDADAYIEQLTARAAAGERDYNAQKTIMQKWSELQRNGISADKWMKDSQAAAEVAQAQLDRLLRDQAGNFAETGSADYNQSVKYTTEKAEELRKQIAQYKTEAQYAQMLDTTGRYDKYIELMKSPDFAKNSQYKSTANGQEKFNAMTGTYTNTGFDDITYDYINRNQDALDRYSLNSIQNNAAFLGLDDSFLQQMTDEEVSVYNYLYSTKGAEEAGQYISFLTSSLEQRQRAKDETYWTEFAQDKPFGAAVWNTATAPLRGLSYLGQVADYADDGKIDQNAAYNRFSYNSTAIRNQVSGYRKNGEERTGFGKFITGTAMSMADFLYTTAITGGAEALNLAIMGSEVAADTVIDAKDRGLSDGQAYALGTIAGAAEALTEKVSVDTLLNPDLLANGLGKYILKNALAEGSEEVGSDLINWMADVLIAGDESEWRQRIQYFEDAGYTESEAFGKAMGEKALEMGTDFLGGALSGFAMAGFGGTINNAAINRAGRSIQSDTELYNALIEDAKAQPAGTTANRLANMDKLNNRQVYQLYNEMVNTERTAPSKTPAETESTSSTAASETAPVGNVVRMHQSTTIDGKAATVDGLTNKHGDLRVLLKTSDGAARVVNINNEAVPEDVREFAQKVSKYGGENAVAMFNAYDGTQDVDRYINAWNTVQNLYGKGTNVTAELVRERSGIARILTDAQLDLALTRGQNMQRTLSAAPMRTGNGSVSLDGATIDGVKYNAVNMDGLTDGQKAAISVVQRLAKTFKINFVFYESTTEQRNGVEYYRGANGAYANNTIYLDINGGKSTTADKAAILRVAGHELTHFIQQYSPAKYNTLKNYIVDTLINRDGMLGNDFETLVKQKMKSQGLAETAAINEVVADACEMMLENSKAIETIASENPSLARTIRDFLRSFAKRLHDAFAGVEAYHAEAKAMEDHVKELQKLWDDALVSAVRGDEATVEQIKTTLPVKEEEWRNKGKKKSGVQLSARDYNPIRETLAKNALDQLSEKLGDRFPLSANFDSTIREDKTPLNAYDVSVGNVAKTQGESFYQAASKAYRSTYGKGVKKIHLSELGIDANLTLDTVGESLSKSNDEETQCIMDMIPQLQDMLESGTLLAVERVHVTNKHTPLFGYRIYNAFNYNTVDNDGNITETERRMLVATVVQSLDNAHVYVFRDIDSTIIDRSSAAKSNSSPHVNNGAIDNVAQLYKTVKTIPRKDGGLLYSSAERADLLFTYTERNDGTQYSQRDSVETRVALADALMTAAETNREKKLVEEYKRKADEVGKINEKLQQTRRELTEARKNGAPKDEITKLQNRAKVYADQVNREDSRLLKIGAMEPVRDVISRVKAEERANATVKRQTAVENARAKGITAVADARAAEQLKAEARLERQKARDAESKANAVAREKLRTEAVKQKLAEEKQARRDDAKAAREKEAADIKALKEKQAQKDADRRESAGVHKYRARVEDKAKTLSDWIIKNSAKEHVPEPLKNVIGDFLESIDFTSRRALDGGEATQKDARFVSRLQKLNTALHGGDKNVTFDEYDSLPEDVLAKLDVLTNEVVEALDINGGTFTVNDMTAEQLEALDEVLGILTHTIRQMNSLYENGRWRSAGELARSTIEEADKMTERRMPKQTKVKWLNKLIAKAYDTTTGFLSWDNLTPVYAFKRMGTAARSIYNGIINGWGKLAVNAREVIRFADGAYTAAEAKEWSEDYRDVQFSDGRTGKMSVAQIMSLYCLVQREQALGHLTVGGLRIGTTTQYNQTTHFTCTLEDAQNIVSTLNARQKAVADKLQQYMQTRGGEWGNEISMLRYGIRQFGELHYFPIDTDNTDRPGVDTNAKKNDLYRLLNIGATKALTPNASNALVVNDIFDVFSEHMADMAKLNALAMPILNTMKWYNYSEKSDTGVTTTVQRSLERVYGKAVNQYVINFVKDLNGVTEGGRGEGALTKLMGNAKAAAVGANLRVVFQQPTSYVRAGLLVKTKYLAKGVFSRSQYEEMMKNSGLAVWKIDLGFFDVNIGTGIREQIKHTQSLRQRITEYSTALAGWADKITWTALWNACKLEVADTQRLTGEELIKATAERFNQVIVETQVMDSTITRSQNMRSNSGLMKQVTSFMSEPTLTYNTLLDAYTSFADEASRTNRQTAMKKHGGHILKTLCVFALSSLATAMAAAISDAGRDDDEYETWLQKYLEAIPENFKDNINPFGLLPILSDIQSMMQGYSNDSLATSGIYKTINAVKSVISTLKREEDLSYKQIYKLMQGVSSLTALPIAPIMRTMQESYNTAAMLWNDTFGYNSENTLPMWHSSEVSDKTQIKNAFNSGHMSEEDAIATLISLGVADSEADAGKIVYGWQNEKAYEPVYEALRGKNAADFKAAKQTMLDYGYDESDINSQVKSKIRELYQGADTEEKLLDKTAALDMLVNYAGMYKSEAEDVLQKWTCKVVTGIDYDDIDESYVAGDITSSRAIELLKKYGGVTDVDAKANILKWNCEKDTGIKYGNLKSAYISGDISQSRAVELRTKYGNDSNAEQNVLEWKCEKDTGVVFDNIKKLYIGGELTASRAIELEETYGTTDDGEALVVSWEFSDKGYNLEAPTARKYLDIVQPSGVSQTDFAEFYLAKNEMKADVNANGKTISGSKKAKVVSYINAMKLTPAQKDALYMLCTLTDGYSESDLKKMPWH